MSRLEQLIEGHLNESISAGDSAELETLLLESRDARDLFRSMTGVHHALSAHYSDSYEAAFHSLSPADRSRPPLSSPLLALAAAVLLVAGLFLLLKFNGREKGEFATVTSVQSSDWSAPVGSSLKQGRHRFSEGVIEILIGRHVRAAIEGPADFEIISKDLLRVTRGLVAADVEEGGIGFTIETPQGRVIDLGTRFGVSVDAEGESQAHVFEGSIDVVKSKKRGRATTRLTKDEAIRLGDGDRRESTPWSFPMPSYRLSGDQVTSGFDSNTQIGENMPAEPNHWSGDQCAIVGEDADGGPVPFEGDGMLQFLSTRSSTTREWRGEIASEIWQIIDLRPYDSIVNRGELNAAVGAHFNRARGSSNPQFQLHLNAFRGQASEMQEYWRRKHEPTSERLGSTSASINTDEAAESWEPLEVGMTVPPGTDFLLVTLLAMTTQEGAEESEGQFRAHFVDGFHLNLVVRGRSSIPKAHWKGEGDWFDPANWEAGLPNPRIEILSVTGPGEAVLSGDYNLKQSLVIATDDDSEGSLRIAPSGRLVKSGYGQVSVGYNPGATARLTIEGQLETRGACFVGRRNRKSFVDLNGGKWNAGTGLIRLAQYDSPIDTTASILIRNGGRLAAGALEMIHDQASLILEDGSVEVEILRVGGGNGTADCILRGGRLTASSIYFNGTEGRIHLESPEAELFLGGEWTAGDLLTLPGSIWVTHGRGIEAADLETSYDTARNRTRIRLANPTTNDSE